MPLELSPRAAIELPIANRHGHARKVVFTELTHKQTDGICETHITVEVVLLSEDGTPLRGGNFVTLPLTFSAMNDTLVDQATGAVLEVFGNWVSEADKQATIDSYPQATMWQGDYFELIRDNVPIKIKDLVLAHMTQAGALGRYDV